VGLLVLSMNHSGAYDGHKSRGSHLWALRPSLVGGVVDNARYDLSLSNVSTMSLSTLSTQNVFILSAV
jgi:hypothetical protein